MIKTATLALTLGTLAVLGLLDGDGILTRAAVAARLFGYEVRVDVTVARPAAAQARPAVTTLPDRCVIAADTVMVVSR